MQTLLKNLLFIIFVYSNTEIILMQRTIILFTLLFVSFFQISAQGFNWGLKGGFGFSYYGIDKKEFTDKKGNPYTVEEAGSVTSIQLGASGFINIKNSSFYFSPELYYINGGGELEFSDLSARIPGGEKTVVTQKDHLFELAALLGFEFKALRIFTGPTFSYRVSTTGDVSNYLDNIFNNGLGETNNKSLYMGIVAGLGYSFDKNTIINIRYSFPILGNEFTIEDNTYTNNLAFSLVSIDLVYMFKQQ